MNFNPWDLDPGAVRTIASEVFIRALEGLYGELGEAIERLKREFPRQGMSSVFDVLGVSPDATEEEVREAYYKKAGKAHPDRGGTDAEMILINQAYEAIKKIKGWK